MLKKEKGHTLREKVSNKVTCKNPCMVDREDLYLPSERIFAACEDTDILYVPYQYFIRNADPDIRGGQCT